MKFLLFLLLPIFCLAQEIKLVEIDSLFREDQFYFGITYNFMQGKPSGYEQNGFSSGLIIGALRDMPFNKKRTWSIATGLGYSYNNLKQNIKIEEDGNNYSYNISSGYDKNKLVLHYLELPLEIRWRNVKFDSHKFYRIYTGIKASYLFANKSEYKSNIGDVKVTKNGSLTKLIFGPYMSVGYNGINLFAYYAIQPIAKNQIIGSQDLELNSFNFGLQFYIL